MWYYKYSAQALSSAIHGDTLCCSVSPGSEIQEMGIKIKKGEEKHSYSAKKTFCGPLLLNRHYPSDLLVRRVAPGCCLTSLNHHSAFLKGELCLDPLFMDRDALQVAM